MLKRDYLIIGSLIFFVLLFLAYQGISGSPLAKTAINFGEFVLKGKEAAIDAPEKQKVVINFTGDVMLGRDVERRLEGKDPAILFSNLTFLKGEGVYTVGNFESAIPKIHIKTPNNTFRFSVSSSTLPGLKRSGFTHFSLANNHTFDYGQPGFASTLSSMAEADITAFGHPSIVATSSVTVIPGTGVKVGVVAIHTLYGDPDSNELDTAFGVLDTQADFKVAYIHWGDEYTNYPNSRQKALAKNLVNRGIDLIIGHHPHVIQSIELVEGVPVLYSLGNLVFDQYFSEETQMGYIASLDTETMVVSLIPTETYTEKTKPRLLSGEAKQAFLTTLASSSDPLLASQILNGEISLTLATSPENGIMSR